MNRIGDLDANLTREAEERNNPFSRTITRNPTTEDSTEHDTSADNDSTKFTRNKNIPHNLKIVQPKEKVLRQGITKQLHKELTDENQRLVNLVRSNKKFEHNNLPKKLCTALKELKSLTQRKVIDIRKVDKGNLILITDFAERRKIEELNITKIAKLCEEQSSNWLDNRKFIDEKMNRL